MFKSIYGKSKVLKVVQQKRWHLLCFCFLALSNQASEKRLLWRDQETSKSRKKVIDTFTKNLIRTKIHNILKTHFKSLRGAHGDIFPKNYRSKILTAKILIVDVPIILPCYHEYKET